MKPPRFIRGYFKELCPSILVETPSPLSPSPYQGEGELTERGTQSLSTTTSPSPLKERGIKGVR